MADHLSPHLSLSKLAKEAAAPEPFRLALSKSVVVEFRDPYSAGLDTFEDFERKFSERDGSIAADLAFLSSMMTPEDYKKYRAENPSARVHKAVTEAVLAHFGDPEKRAGESAGSAG